MNVDTLRQQFPMVRERPGIAYFDYGASAPKPDQVLEQERRFYERHYANVHRGVHRLSQEASHLFEKSRQVVAAALGTTAGQVVFTGGTTDGLNLLAQALALYQRWGPGDEILVTELEHHANLLPWQALAQRYGATLRYVPLQDDGTLADPRPYLTPQTRVFAFAHVSNVLGSLQPVADWVRAAHEQGTFVVVDGAQAFAHLSAHELNLVRQDVDAYVLSAHKAYGPTGLGVLYLKGDWVNALPPTRLGGGIVEHVSMTHASFVQGPARHEAGTPPIAQAVGFAGAVQWLDSLGQTVVPGTGRDRLAEHGQALLAQLEKRLRSIEGVRLVGTGVPHRHGAITFWVNGSHAHDLGTWLDQGGFAVRVGHHCAMPLMQRLGVSSGVRASVGATNTDQEVDALADSVAAFAQRWARPEGLASTTLP